MTNDSRKGWRYKLETDKNARRRREPEVRRRVEHFKRNSRAKYCHSRSRTWHGGPLEVQHVGGLKRDQARQRLTWMCRKHNREEERIPAGKGARGDWVYIAIAAAAVLLWAMLAP